MICIDKGNPEVVQDTRVIYQQVTWVTFASNQDQNTDVWVVHSIYNILNGKATAGVRNLLCLIWHDHRGGQGGDWREQARGSLA